MTRPAMQSHLPGLPQLVDVQPDGVLVIKTSRQVQTLSLVQPRVLCTSQQHYRGLNQVLFDGPEQHLLTTNPRGEVWRWDQHVEDPALLNQLRRELELASGMTIDDEANYRLFHADEHQSLVND